MLNTVAVEILDGIQALPQNNLSSRKLHGLGTQCAQYVGKITSGQTP